MYYVSAAGDVVEIGFLKIYSYNNDETRTDNYHEHTRHLLDNPIVNLSSQYCSLGQDLSYYKNLVEYFPTEYTNILLRLNDIATNAELNHRFINEAGVKASLLRFSGAEKALEDANSLLKGVSSEAKNVSFKYCVTVPYSETPIELEFDFTKSEYLPYRINFLVGKNGTGKTQILSRLANALSGVQNPKMFPNGRPPVDKVMSISYSAFDSFKKPNMPKEQKNINEFTDFSKQNYKQEPNNRQIFSYVYCGIQSEKGTLSLQELDENFKKTYATVCKLKRKDIWSEIISELMEIEHSSVIGLIESQQSNQINWSSGQHILICTITELIANIENESIILFDEPEIHLHPNAIANVMRMFYKLLEKFNSYAIFSTHSPIILQEIPSNHILVLHRQSNMLTIRKPAIECFGNNISNIISDLFDVSGLESNYKNILSNLCKIMSYDGILLLFKNDLSLNALMYLKNCCEAEEENRDSY